jgi:hypothetical protein
MQRLFRSLLMPAKNEEFLLHPILAGNPKSPALTLGVSIDPGSEGLLKPGRACTG